MLRKSFTGGSCSPEQPWLAPETFACLETFGPANKDDMPYEIFGMGPNESGFDRVSFLIYAGCIRYLFHVLYLFSLFRKFPMNHQNWLTLINLILPVA